MSGGLVNNMNSMYFGKKELDAMYELVRFLNEQSYKSESYNDIHIFPADLGAFIVEWAQVPWDHSYGGNFRYVDDNQTVCTELRYPDDTFGYVEDPEEALKEWLEEHPGWTKDEWGYWHHENIINHYTVKPPTVSVGTTDDKTDRPNN